MFIWTQELVDAVRRRILGTGMDFTISRSEGTHREELLPGLYRIKSAGAGVALSERSGGAIQRDANDYPAENASHLYMLPGDVEEFTVALRSTWTIEVDTGGYAHLRRLAR